MEPFLTVKCLKSLKKKGFNVKKLTMDDDTTTFIRAKKAIKIMSSRILLAIYTNFDRITRT